MSRDPIEEDGALSLYVFVENKAIAFVDVLGREFLLSDWGSVDWSSLPLDHMGNPYLPSTTSSPPPKKVSTAGPDITAALIATHKEVIQKFLAAPVEKRKCACRNLWEFPEALGSWDIEELHAVSNSGPAGWGVLHNGVKSGTGGWGSTVQLQSHGVTRVYYAGDVNYALYGWANALCYLNFSWSPQSEKQRYAEVDARLTAEDYRWVRTFLQQGNRAAKAAGTFVRYGYMGTDPKSAALSTDKWHTADPAISPCVIV